MKRIPKTKEDFAWAQWDADTIRRVATEILAKKKELYAQVKAIPAAERTFENTLYGIERANEVMNPVSFFEILLNASPETSVRAAAEEVIKKIAHETVDMEYDEGMYRAFKDFADKKLSLEGEDKRLFEDTTRAYKRMGFHLPTETREKVKIISKRLSTLSTDFHINIQKYEDHILVTREELDGLPEHYIEGLTKDEGGKYIVSLKYPEMVPFIERSKSDMKRKELMDKNLQKGGPANATIAKEILGLRKECAQLLGYPTHGDYVTEPRMAKSRKTVVDFLSRFMTRLQGGADIDLKDLQTFKKNMTGDNDANIQYYDGAFYATLLEKERFNVDSEKIRQYFPLEHVVEQMFELYQTLFSLKFEKLSEIPLWHPDAQLYEVSGADGLVGYFYLDLFPRDNKFNHAACFTAVSARALEFGGQEFESPVSGVLANFNKPASDRPSLLSHDEVTTLFHEFGHVMSSLLVSTRYVSLAGVAWDFVEVPSLLFEYWAWDKELLKRISKHYETGEPLPNEMIDNMIKGKNFLIGRALMRQVIFSWFDIQVHGETYPDDLPGFFNELSEKLLHLKYPSLNLFPAWFGHFSGYDAGYYSYLWSHVICADMFVRFKKSGLLNPEIGNEFREKVLAVGGSRDEADTVKDFLGREFTEDAYLEEIGITSNG